MSEPVRKPGAVVPPVDPALFGAHIRVDDTASDVVIEAYLQAATSHVEAMIGRALSPQTWTMVLDGFPAGFITLPIGPVSEVVSIKYFAADGSEVELDVALYRADLSFVEARLSPVGSWPSTDGRPSAVTVEWLAGADGCPQDLAQAIMMLAASWFANREAVVTGSASELPLAVKALLAPHIRFRG